MPQLRELRQKHHKGLEAIRALDKKIDEEKRDYSAKENEEREKLFKECTDLKNKIEKREKVRSLELENAKANSETNPWEGEGRKYSLTKAILMANGDRDIDFGFEKEIHQELRRKQNFNPSGDRSVLVPRDELLSFGRKPEKRIVSGETALIQDTIRGEETIPSLKERNFWEDLGVTILQAAGKFEIPRSGGVDSDWVSGSGGSTADDKIVDETPDYDSVEFSPKHLAVSSAWSLSQVKEMSMSPSIEELLRNDLSMEIDAKLFKDFLSATGSGNKKPIKGLFTLITNNTAKTTSSSSKWSYNDLETIVQKFIIASKMQGRKPKWLFQPVDRTLLRKERILTGSTDSKRLWEDSMAEDFSGMVCGLKAIPTNNLVNQALLGDFSQAILAQFGGIEIMTGFSGDDFLRGTTRIRAIVSCDVNLRRPEFFQKITLTRG